MLEEKLFPKVFMWLFVGLFLSFLTGLYVASNANMIYNIVNKGLYLPLMLIEIGLVIYLSARINKMSYTSAVIAYIVYAIMSGLTLSVIFVAFSMTSVVSVFGITALIFLIFAGLGYVTKIDLTKLGTIAFMGLIGIIIVSIVNMFIGNNAIDLGIAIISIIVFIAFIAYDIQKIKRMAYQIADPNKIAVIGALSLYLDFINLFIRLLSLFGRRRN